MTALTLSPSCINYESLKILVYKHSYLIIQTIEQPGMNTSGSSASGASRRMSGGSGSVNSRTQEGQRVDKIDSM